MDTIIQTPRLDGPLYAAMLRGGAAALAADKQAVNDLNVFPIPDGDTGDNMLMTIRGGLLPPDGLPLGETARRAAEGMLLGARGNSGVILSQFFDGLSRGLDGMDTADAPALCRALDAGVKQAYAAVMTPAEGTILTVMREAAAAAETAAAEAAAADGVTGCFAALLDAARLSLDRTPDLLPVLREAGVVDSGGAGFVDILAGMLAVLRGDAVTGNDDETEETDASAVDLDSFGPDSVPEFGYCTELLLRLQRVKCDPDSFDVSVITDYLASVGGNSVVCFRTGSVVKLHVHTLHPQDVLSFCQRFGEFLTVKIENMSLQHSELEDKNADSAAARTQAGLVPGQTRTHKRALAVVAAACGDGIKRLLREAGADVIVDGGQSMNPSAQDFLTAFDEADADTILVLPDNGNVILSAKQAAALYTGSRVRVVETKSVGAGYAALCGCAGLADPDAAEAAMTAAAGASLTACVSECVRDSDFGGVTTHPGDFIGFTGKDILSVAPTAASAACALFDALDTRGLLHGKTELLTALGADAPDGAGEQILAHVRAHAPKLSVQLINGGQPVYAFVMMAR